MIAVLLLLLSEMVSTIFSNKNVINDELWFIAVQLVDIPAGKNVSNHVPIVKKKNNKIKLLLKELKFLSQLWVTDTQNLQKSLFLFRQPGESERKVLD